ncbi:MAG: hypothetical protein RMJ07_04165 [Nitrososphaerota archaeon]|nr:hypothetical protein [Candidatus Bathyarchaeota archaeon]MDW8048859.1 hypothetical protein [Nitrososphaerota archaeon]
MAQNAEYEFRPEVLVLAHCLLNYGTRWWQYEPSNENRGPCPEIVRFLVKHRVGAIQLPCPEYSFCGNPRPPRTKDEYERTPSFSSHCKDLAVGTARYLKAMARAKDGSELKILAIVGVEHSPTCAVKSTPRIINGLKVYVEEKGLFMDLLEKELIALGLNFPFIDVNLNDRKEIGRRLNFLLRKPKKHPGCSP